MSAIALNPAVELRRRYEELTPESRALAARAGKLFPNGVTHVTRFLEPYSLYIVSGAGSRKWDVDGNEYVDYFGGHGALILGHCHPQVMEAVSDATALGVHFGGSHEGEIDWAEQIQRMVPSAQRIRFTVTGTEATHLAIRIARAFSGKRKILRFASHFHGWHDHVSFAPGGAPGIVPGIVEDTIIVAPNDFAAVEQALDGGDVALVMLEPTGATFGHVPTGVDFLRSLRQLTADRGVLLMFDEVISGFRCSKGGAQAFYGITPDLTSLAKIIAGGFPGAALVGRADVFEVLEYTHADGKVQSPKVPHQGTYNAGPISAAAGLATLKIIETTDIIERANRSAAAIRAGFNKAIRERGLPWCAYGLFSDFHVYMGGGIDPGDVDAIYSGRVPWTQLKGAVAAEKLHQMRLAMLCNGVDIVGWPGGVVSGVHTEEDVERTVNAFAASLEWM